MPAARDQAGQQRHLHAEFAEFVETFSRLATPPRTPATLLRRGRRARHRERAEDGVRLEGPQELRRGLTEERGHQILHLRHAFHGRSGYTLSLTNTADPRKTQYFPKFDWPRLRTPALRFPATEEVLPTSRPRRPGRRRDPRGLRRPAGRHRRAHHRADPGRGRRQPFPPRVLPPSAGAGRRARVPADLRRGPDRRRPDRGDVGLPALRRRARHLLLRQEDPGLRLRVEQPDRRRRTTSSRSPPASTPRGAATSSTWSAAPRYLEIIEEENLIDNARVVGEHLLGRLRDLPEEFPGVVSNVRGRGLFLAFDLPDKAIRDRTLAACMDHGMMALASGAVRPLPPAPDPLEGRGGRRRSEAPQGHRRDAGGLIRPPSTRQHEFRRDPSCSQDRNIRK